MPARWYVGGKGLDDFRQEMIQDKHIAILQDFIDSKAVFPGVAIEGGVCYFLRKENAEGPCIVGITSKEGKKQSTRYLQTGDADVLIRYETAITIYDKVSAASNNSGYFSSLVWPRRPFGIDTVEEKEMSRKPITNGLVLHILIDRAREIRYLKPDFDMPSGKELLPSYKVFISKADGAAGQVGNPIPANIIGRSIAGYPNSLCTETFLAIGPFNTEEMMLNAQTYLKTKFCRFLIGIRKSKNMTMETYSFVPLQDFTSHSDIDWSKSIPEIDQQLYRKYDLSPDEISFIEKMIKPME